MKNNALIFYENGQKNLELIANNLKLLLSESGFKIKSLETSKIGIPDILASDVLIIGTSADNSPYFSELQRIFSGINLAGRKALLFTDKQAKNAKYLRDMLADSEIQIYSEIYCPGTNISKWLKMLANDLIDNNYGTGNIS